MKKILLLTMLLTLPIPGIMAQDWLEALKKTATTAADDATGGKLTELALSGTWTYARPSVRFEGTDAASDFSGSLVEALLVDQIAKAYAKGGIEAGQATLHFDRKTSGFTATFGPHSISGTYAFDASSHAITFSPTGGSASTDTLSIPSHAYLSGEELTIVFPVTRLVEIARTVGDQVESLSSLAALLSSYENAYIGFAFSK